MTMPPDKTSDKKYITIMLVAIVFTSIAIAVVPTANSVWDDGAVTWHRFTWWVGRYYQYDRIPDNEFENFVDGYEQADGFSWVIPILMIIAILLPAISVFFIGKNKWQSFIFQRVFASLITLGAIAGILSTIFFGLFYAKQTVDPHMVLHVGFYLSAVYFVSLFFVSLKPIVTSNQIPKPKITPAPPQEGQLMDEDKKLKNKRKLFEHLDEIEETADEEY